MVDHAFWGMDPSGNCTCDDCSLEWDGQGPDPTDEPCNCGFDLCGECMRIPGPKRSMVTPGKYFNDPWGWLGSGR